MTENKLLDLSFEFAVAIVKLVDGVTAPKSSYMTDQLARAGTSVGANIHEAQYAQSKKDFVAKLEIALKESNETSYWLKLMYETQTGGAYMADAIVEKLESWKSFRVDAYCEGYPDVIFEIILDAVPTGEQTQIAVDALQNFMYSYNRFHFLRPIHYVSDVDSLPEQEHPRGIYIHVDFGGCNPAALIKAVAALEQTNLPIFRVALL